MDHKILIKFIWILNNSILYQKSIYKSYKRFTEGREDVDDDNHPGVPTTTTSEENIKEWK